MSMKRSKEVSRGRAREVDGGFWEKKDPERSYAWDGDVAAQPDEAFVAYAPAQRYAKDVLVVHPKFGKGIVTDVDGGKIDVLFQDGPKKLTHGLAGGPVIVPKIIEAPPPAAGAATEPAPPPVHVPDVPVPVTPLPPADLVAAAPPSGDRAPTAPPADEPPTDVRATLEPPTDPDPSDAPS